MSEKTITFTLPTSAIKGLINKLDMVAGTRLLCNFFEEGVKKSEALQTPVEPTPVEPTPGEPGIQQICGTKNPKKNDTSA